MTDHWVRLGMAIVVIAFVSVCLYAAGSHVRHAEPGQFTAVYGR